MHYPHFSVPLKASSPSMREKKRNVIIKQKVESHNMTRGFEQYFLCAKIRAFATQLKPKIFG